MCVEVMKISCTEMLTLLDEIFIVVIGAGTFIGRKHIVSNKEENKMDIVTEG